MTTNRVLLVEDVETDAELVQIELIKSFAEVEVSWISSEIQFREALDLHPWDCVLCDYNLPGFDPHKALKILKEAEIEAPFILISGAIGEEAAIELLKAGVDDVVTKGKLYRLPLVINRVQREFSTRKKEREARDLAERAVAAREQMLTIVSHDLRNPLGAIQLNIETARSKLDRLPANAETQAILNNFKAIERSALRMKSMISDVLDKVRLESGTFSINRSMRNLNEFVLEVREVFDPIAQDKGITFRVQNLEKVVFANLDYERVFQILSNLVGNSIKFTPKGGVIELSMAAETDQVSFQVRDSGQGIGADKLAQVFEKYWQDRSTSRLGIGLGLSIVRELVQAHGGEVHAESRIGYGSRFFFTLPCEVRALGSREASLSTDESLKPRDQNFIFVIDDDEDLREIVEESLRSMGYLVKGFSDAPLALIELKNVTTVKPDLVIVDYRLPHMSGGEFIRQLANGNPSTAGGSEGVIPTILSSADDGLPELARTYGATAFLRKPPRLTELSFVVRQILDNQKHYD